MNELLKPLQSALGVKPDGVRGPITTAAILAAADDGRLTVAKAAPASADLPWMAEARKVMGRHEATNNAELRAWLKSDGETLGDPSKLPWCGDFVATAILLGLPAERFPGALDANPYWARNWALFGRETEPTYGCVLVFSRDGGGHVGFAVGQDASCYHVLGGNQSNRVSITRIVKSRMIAARWPSSYPAQPISLPQMAATGTTSTNEA